MYQLQWNTSGNHLNFLRLLPISKGSFCFCVPSSSPKRVSNLDEKNPGFLKAPNAQMMNQNISTEKNIEIMKKKMQFSLNETAQPVHEEKRQFTTFKEWLLASPPTNGFYTSSGDEILQQRNLMKQNKVYPSLVGDCPDYGYNTRGSFSKKRLLMDSEIDSCSDIVSSMRKSRNKKIKKRVSFRMPEEADFFIYNLTEEDD